MMNHTLRKSRKKMLRRFGITIFSFCLTLAFAICLGFSVKAEEQADPNVTYKYFKSIEVEKGDTLWSIAQRNMSGEYESINEYMDEIVSMNKLTGSKLHAGQSITIPYYSNEYIR